MKENKNNIFIVKFQKCAT